MTNLKTKILWFDGLGALSVGLLMLIFSFWLSELYLLPENLLVLMGVVNILYGLYSTRLAVVKRPSKRLVYFLIRANFIWALVCFCLFLHFINTASVFGLAQLFAEGIYVAGLAFFEWRCRDNLITNKG